MPAVQAGKCFPWLCPACYLSVEMTTFWPRYLTEGTTIKIFRGIEADLCFFFNYLLINDQLIFGCSFVVPATAFESPSKSKIITKSSAHHPAWCCNTTDMLVLRVFILTEFMAFCLFCSFITALLFF